MVGGEGGGGGAGVVGGATSNNSVCLVYTHDLRLPVVGTAVGTDGIVGNGVGGTGGDREPGINVMYSMSY